MTSEDKEEKTIQKDLLNKELLKLQLKMKLAVKLMHRYESLFRALRARYEKLDRELFESDPGITVVKAKRKTTETKIFSDYDKMSTDEQKDALARLLEIQANMKGS